MPRVGRTLASLAAVSLVAAPIAVSADQIVARAPTGVTPEAETKLAELTEPRDIKLSAGEDALSVARRLCGRLTDTYVKILLDANAPVPPGSGRAIIPACFVTRIDQKVGVVPGETLKSVIERNVGLAGPKAILKVVTANLNFGPFHLGGAGVVANAPLPASKTEVTLPVATEPVVYSLKRGYDATDAASKLIAALGASPTLPNLPQPADELRLESGVDPALVGKGQCGGLATQPVADWPFSASAVLAALDRDDAYRRSHGVPAAAPTIAAVVDNGVDGIFKPWFPAADFAVNALEADDPNDGIDHDGNGYADDVVGTNVMTPGPPTPFLGVKDAEHGTMMASLLLGGPDFRAALVAANKTRRVLLRPISIVRRDVQSINGVNQTVFRLPAEGLEKAVDYALKTQARVVSLSVSTPNRLEKLETAVINNADLLLVVASGNHATPLDSQYLYPAGMSGRNSGSAGRVITVAAHDRRGCFSAFAGRGGKIVDFAAPGEAILATGLNNQAVVSEGTSQATAITAYFASLLRSEGLVLAASIQNRFAATVDLKPYLIGQVRSEGILNGIKALRVHDDIVETADGILHFGNFPARPQLAEICPQENFPSPATVMKISKRIDGGDPAAVRILVSLPLAEGDKQVLYCTPTPNEQLLTASDGTVLRFHWSEIMDAVPKP